MNSARGGGTGGSYNASLTSKSSHGIRSPDQIKTKMQRTALQLMQREERNAKKSRLEALLQQQFIAKYGSKQSSSAINSIIRSTIAEFLESFVNVSDAEKDIQQLEQLIRVSTSQMKEDLVLRKKMESEQRRREDNEARRRYEEEARQQATIDPTTRVLKELTNTKAPMINAVVSSATEEVERERELRQQKDKQIKFKLRLDEQLASKSKVKYDSLSEKEQQLRSVQAKLTEYQREQEDKKHQREEHFRSEREMRMKQIEENKMMRERERQMKIAIEQAEMARSRRLVQEDEEQKRYLKEQQKLAQDRLIIENEENKRLKEEALRKQHAYEKKLNEDYE